MKKKDFSAVVIILSVVHFLQFEINTTVAKC